MFEKKNNYNNKENREVGVKFVQEVAMLNWHLYFLCRLLKWDWCTSGKKNQSRCLLPLPKWVYALRKEFEEQNLSYRVDPFPCSKANGKSQELPFLADLTKYLPSVYIPLNCFYMYQKFNVIRHLMDIKAVTEIKDHLHTYWNYRHANRVKLVGTLFDFLHWSFSLFVNILHTLH